MKSPIGNATIDSFREHIADAKDPIAGGGAVASVSASFGMALLALTLKVASKRKDFSGDRTRLIKLMAAVKRESALLARCADQDIAAYQQYRDSLKRKRGVEAAQRRIVETPLEAAGSATRGVDFCEEAVSLAPVSVASDLGAAATLLAGKCKGDPAHRRRQSPPAFARQQASRQSGQDAPGFGDEGNAASGAGFAQGRASDLALWQTIRAANSPRKRKRCGFRCAAPGASSYSQDRAARPGSLRRSALDPNRESLPSIRSKRWAVEQCPIVPDLWSKQRCHRPPIPPVEG